MSGPDPRLLAGLADWGIDVDPGVSSLAGDASTRRYYRGSRDARSVVIMDCGAPLPEGGESAFPFVRWLREYEALGIRVPELLGVDGPRGLLLLEDLGDELLQSRLERAGAGACAAHYRRATEWGLRLAGVGTRRFHPDAGDSDDPLIPSRLALEMDLFLVHASRVALSPATAQMPPLARAALILDEQARESGGTARALTECRALLHRLCSDVHGSAHAPRPMVLCHRDYHARNLLVLPREDGSEDVAVIDFQDTRRGPRAYDLVSLAFDPYVSLPGSLIDELIEAWRPSDASRDAWTEEVSLAAGQRLLKAASSYAWLGRDCGRPEYLQWLGPALERAHERLAAWPSRDHVWRLLAECGALRLD
jgi:aminoglycoside/choline kinase family phosphotransferase